MKILKVVAKDDNLANKNDILKDHQFTHFFQSRLHEIVFYFKVNNPEFDSELNIKLIHKIDPTRAANLKKTYLRLFHPDANGSNSDFDYKDVCQNIDDTFFRVTSGRLE